LAQAVLVALLVHLRLPVATVQILRLRELEHQSPLRVVEAAQDVLLQLLITAVREAVLVNLILAVIPALAL
jgi:hypothetical protein